MMSIPHVLLNGVVTIITPSLLPSPLRYQSFLSSESIPVPYALQPLVQFQYYHVTAITNHYLFVYSMEWSMELSGYLYSYIYIPGIRRLDQPWYG